VINDGISLMVIGKLLGHALAESERRGESGLE
jgi:hypothetical protein